MECLPVASKSPKDQSQQGAERSSQESVQKASTSSFAKWAQTLAPEVSSFLLKEQIEFPQRVMPLNLSMDDLKEPEEPEE